MKTLRVLLIALLLLCAFVPRGDSARGRKDSGSQNSFRRAASGVYQALSGVFGEDTIKTLYKFFTKTTERFVHGVDLFLDTMWKIWTDLLDVLGVDSSNLSHYFSPASVANSPARALLLVAAVLLAYWFLSLSLGGFFYLLHAVFGRFFWLVLWGPIGAGAVAAPWRRRLTAWTLRSVCSTSGSAGSLITWNPPVTSRSACQISSFNWNDGWGGVGSVWCG